MALIKVRNKGERILFIDSLGLTLRPSVREDDFLLVDKEKAENDPQFMKCKILGSIESCDIDKNFSKNKTDSKSKQIIKSDKKKDDEEIKFSKSELKINKKGKKKTNELIGEEIEEFIEPPEPNNSDPVIVVPGISNKSAKTARVKSYKLSDSPMPKFIKESDIRDMSEEDVDAEARGEKDIDLSKED